LPALDPVEADHFAACLRVNELAAPDFREATSGRSQAAAPLALLVDPAASPCPSVA